MSKILSLLFLIVFLLHGCIQQESSINYFNELEDTLIIHKTVKLPGPGLFSLGAGPKTFRHFTEWQSFPRFSDFPINNVVFPDDVKDIKIGIESIVFPSNKIRFYDTETKQDIFNDYPTKAESIILSLTGTLNNETIYIVDQNNNRDFTDDVIRTFLPFDWGSSKNLIECTYDVFRGEQLIIDTGWIKIGLFHGNIISGVSQHNLYKFSIGNSSFTVGVSDWNSGSFCFHRPQLALFSQNEAIRDTLLRRDYIEIGEYIKLGNDYYRFHDFYNGCGKLILIKDKDMALKIGAQVGLIAPPIKFVSTSGDTIMANDLKDENLLVANITSCTPETFNVYNKLINANIPNLKIIGLEVGNVGLGGIMVDLTNDYNQELYLNYRNALSSFDMYLINKEGRVIDKIDILELEKSFSRLTDSIR